MTKIEEILKFKIKPKEKDIEFKPRELYKPQRFVS